MPFGISVITKYLHKGFCLAKLVHCCLIQREKTVSVTDDDKNFEKPLGKRAGL